MSPPTAFRLRKARCCIAGARKAACRRWKPTCSGTSSTRRAPSSRPRAFAAMRCRTGAPAARWARPANRRPRGPDASRPRPAQPDRPGCTVVSTLGLGVLKRMEDRKQAILRAVVHEFTTSAVPVGSQALQSRYFVNLSSATIRSELAELADQGYLTQPHTSAGRVPTDSGYRYFVDFLMDLEPVPDRVRAYIKDEMRAAPADVQGMVERVAMTVASVTQNASVASAPQGALARIKHVDLVSLEPKEVLMILL